MYIAKKQIETRFKKVFKKGEIVPDEIAKFYLRDVEIKGDVKNVKPVTEDTKENIELLIEEPSESLNIEKIDETDEVKEAKPKRKNKKK